MYLHITARRDPRAPLQPSQRAWLWSRLRVLHPFALAAAILPSELQLVVPAGDVGDALRRTEDALSWFEGRFGEPPGRWAPLAPSPLLRGRMEALRAVRQVLVAPCDSGAADPLEWLWSTHRGTLGGAASPWVPPARLAAAFGARRAGLGPRLHRRVCADPAVRVVHPTVPRLSGAALHAGLDGVARAAAVAVRHVVPGGPDERRAVDLFLVLGRALRHPTRSLAAHVGLSSIEAYRRMGGVDAGSVEAALLVLSDDRLSRPQDVEPGPLPRAARSRSLAAR